MLNTDTTRYRSAVTRLLAILFVVSLATPAGAVPIVFFGEDLNGAGSGRITIAGSNSEAARNSFLANLTGVGTEDFESFADGAVAPLALSFPGSSGAITATLSGDSNVDEVTTGTSGAGRWPTSGDKYWTTNSGTTGFSMSFSDPISAFGFYATDVGDFQGQLSIELVNGGVTAIEIPHTLGAPNASLLFFGVIDPMSSFTSVSFSSSSQDDFFGIDDVTIGDSRQVTLVTEPTTLALLGMGLAGFASARRRAA